MRIPMPDVLAARPIRRLLYILRWAILAFVLITALTVHFPSALVQRRPIVYAVVMLALATLVIQFAARKWPQLRKPALELVADAILVTIVTYFSDGIQSPFYPLYYMTVIAAAVDFGIPGAMVCATIVAAVSLAVDWISPTVHATEGLIPADVVASVPYLFLIGLVSGALMNRIRVLDRAAAHMQAERAANERELEVAAQVQRAQLPTETPNVNGVRITAFYKPAREVGGDIYDFHPVQETSLGVLVADVSGKGVPAALLVCSCKYAVRASCVSGIDEAMTSANNDLLGSTTDEVFVTAVYGNLDTVDRTFRYVNAGHMPPMVVKRDGRVLCAEHSDPPLGITKGCRYVEQRLQLDPGDTLVLYTDGVTDALAKGTSGIEELKSLLSEVAAQDINTWGDELVRRTAAPQHVDDMTMVAMQLS